MKNNLPKAIGRTASGFTLVELLLSMTILSILLVMVTSVIAEVQKAWKQTSAKVSQFREARRAFDILKRNLSQATLNTYLLAKYNNPDNPFSPFRDNGQEIEDAVPLAYNRYSELQFVVNQSATLIAGGDPAITPGHAVFFQAPLGFSGKYSNLPTTLNGRGYYVKFGDDSAYRPPFLPDTVPLKFRYRLMEYAPPAEQNKVYDPASATVQSDWFPAAELAAWSRPIADNIVTLILSPKRPVADNTTGDPRDIAPAYAYNSVDSGTGSTPQAATAHVLPPEVEVLMAVIDEASASNLALFQGSTPPLAFNGFTEANENQFRRDITMLEQALVAAKVNFRIFTATVTLRNSKWNG